VRMPRSAAPCVCRATTRARPGPRGRGEREPPAAAPAADDSSDDELAPDSRPRLAVLSHSGRNKAVNDVTRTLAHIDNVLVTRKLKLNQALGSQSALASRNRGVDVTKQKLENKENRSKWCIYGEGRTLNPECSEGVCNGISAALAGQLTAAAAQQGDRFITRLRDNASAQARGAPRAPRRRDIDIINDNDDRSPRCCSRCAPPPNRTETSTGGTSPPFKKRPNRRTAHSHASLTRPLTNLRRTKLRSATPRAARPVASRVLRRAARFYSPPFDSVTWL
ncbi:hypothetical protein MSG28_015574, partial [Choristoneura fumiferana]